MRRNKLYKGGTGREKEGRNSGREETMRMARRNVRRTKQSKGKEEGGRGRREDDHRRWRESRI